MVVVIPSSLFVIVRCKSRFLKVYLSFPGVNSVERKLCEPFLSDIFGFLCSFDDDDDDDDDDDKHCIYWNNCYSNIRGHHTQGWVHFLMGCLTGLTNDFLEVQKVSSMVENGVFLT